MPLDIGGGSTGTGTPGAPGSVWYNGAGVPSSVLGINGDYYLNNQGGDVYKKTGGVWSVTANIEGSTWYNGAGAPAGATGRNGDYYLNDTNGDVYVKTGVTTWVIIANIKGPTGATGATGPAGPSGVSLTGYNAVSCDYTLQLSDAGQMIGASVGTGNKIIVPLNATVPFVAGNTVIDIMQVTAGTGVGSKISIAAVGGVTIHNADTMFSTAKQWTVLSLFLINTDEWVLVGNVIT